VIKILYSFAFDSANVTSSSEASGCADENVLDDRLGAVWRTTGCSAEWVQFDAGGDIQEIAIFGHNLTQSATITVKAGFSSPPTLDMGTITWHEENLVKFPTPYGLPPFPSYWRIEFADSGNPDGYIEIGRICGGIPLTPDVNFNFGAKRRRIVPMEKPRSKGQDAYPYTEDPYWIYDMRFDVLERADKDYLRTLFRTIGKDSPLVVTLDPDNELNVSTIYGYITNDYEEDYQSPVPTFGVGLEVEEIV
jgi:hypothetical protein